MIIAISNQIREVLAPGSSRESFDFLKRVENPSLILDRYGAIWKDLGETEDRQAKQTEQRARSKFLEALVKRKPAAGALEMRRRWFESLAEDEHAAVLVARLQSRLIVNQAASVLENAGLALDRTFGVPYIPGSAVKGVTRAWALQAARAGKLSLLEVLAVFGWAQAPSDRRLLEEAGAPPEAAARSFAGLVAFLPAFPVEDKDAPLGLDIVNCHHRRYYDREPKLERAWDVELPVPNTFPVVEPGGRFFFTVRASTRPNARVWVCKALALEPFDPLERAKDWLKQALEENGIGAKTGAGYGWFRVDEGETARFVAEVRDRIRAAREAEAERRREESRRQAMAPEERAREEIRALDQESFAHFARALAEKSEAEQRAFLAELRENRKDRFKSWKKKKPELAESIAEVARRLGEELP